jgi:hypothetical protein
MQKYTFDGQLSQVGVEDAAGDGAGALGRAGQ